MCFFCKISIKSSTYFIALILSVLILVSCTKLQSDVTSFSEKVKETFQAKNKETVTAGRLNLREEPSSQSRVISVLRKGDELEVHHLNGKWARVETSDERRGWVYARYISGFEDLFTEKQPVAEIRKSTQKSGAGQPTDTEETAGKQRVVLRDKTARQNPQNQDPAESAPEKPSYPAATPAVADSPTGDRDDGGQPVSDSEIETTKIPPAAGAESGAGAEGDIASIQIHQSQAGQEGPSVFSHSEGLFSLQIPMDWDNNTENQDYFEKYIFIDPSREMEVWVVYTPSEDYSEDEFYRDLASLLMERSAARTVVSPSSRQKADTGPEWLYGKVEIKSEPVKTHEYWIKEHDGRLWAITEVYNQTAAEAASKKLFEIRRSFAFGPKPASTP